MVEWKKLGEIVSYYRGVTYNKKQEVALNSGGTKILRANNIDLETNTLLFDDVKEISSTVKIKDHQWLYPNDILICAGSGSKEHVGKVAFIKEKIDYAYGGFMGKLVSSERLLPRYLFHIISGSLFKRYLNTALNSTTINNLNSEIVNNFQIPFPSIAEQERIVGILDTFTAAIDNLKQQIAQRRKQYNFLIDKAFGGSVSEMKQMAERGEIIIETLAKHGTFTRGKRFVRTDIVDEGQPCIHYGDMYTYYGLQTSEAKTHLPIDFPKKMRYAENGDVIIVGAGENNEDIGVGLVWFGEKPAAVHDACYIYKSDFDPMFVSYFLRSGIYHLQIKSNVVRGKICSISSDGIGRALIPIYSLEKQKEIVEQLSPFELLITNLEKQLALREKQYEYYRNQLLTFE
ncbi:MAG: restriction endonuclease subunit S [Prevotella sp.]|nr:restriction endonuclease subunit S [Prevotella sp.]